MAPNHPSDRRIEYDRRTVLRAIPLAGLTWAGTDSTAASGAGNSFPDVISLPIGFQPEGIVAGRGPEFFVGSLAVGAIYQGDLRT